MKKQGVFLMMAVFSLVFIIGCSDDPTKVNQTINVSLGEMSLESAGAGAQALATTPGNPSCSIGMTSLNTLLADVENWDYLGSHLDDISISKVRYMVTRNDTPADITGSLQMTDPDTGLMADIGSGSITAMTTVTTWTELPFATGGAAIVQHYLDNRDAMFSYCGAGSPDDDDISLTIEVELEVNVTIDII